MSRRHNTVSQGTGGGRVLHVPGDRAPAPEVLDDASPDDKAKAAGWAKGQLLNVRNASTDHGSLYRVTLQGEEYDPTNPHRCIQFVNVSAVQDFVARWYSPEPGPRPPWG